jgi:hypothetical protein
MDRTYMMIGIMEGKTSIVHSLAESERAEELASKSARKLEGESGVLTSWTVSSAVLVLKVAMRAERLFVDIVGEGIVFGEGAR